MSTEVLKETIKRELPGLLREDPALREFVLEIGRREFAGREETQDRFYELLAELRRDREEQSRKWDENQEELRRHREEQERKWEEQNRKWQENQEELRRHREEQERKWEEQNRKWQENQEELRRHREEQERKWEEQNRKWQENQEELRRNWEEQNRKWQENQEELKRLHHEIMAQAERHDRSIGALGARWGLQSEKAFRDALAGILERSFGVEVLNVVEFDETGEVFGRPEQVELDVIIKNGLLLICELKSSIDKAGMYSFERKARFYERLHRRQANRLIVISPMIDPRAQKVAERLGIETYGDSADVASL